VPRLAVIVPATDGPPTLERVLAAIRPQLGGEDELVVQRTPSGAGPALGRNLAAQATSGQVLVFVDADVVAAPDALARIRGLMAAPGPPDAVFGAYDDEPADPGPVSRYRNLLHHHVHCGSPGEAETFWAGLGAVRREAFDAVGGFDALRFPSPSVEDIDLGMRMRDRGARIVLDPAIRGTHLKRWTLRSMVATDFGRRGRPWARLLMERGERSTALNLSGRRSASAGLSVAAAAALATGRGRLAAGGIAGVAALNLDLLALLARRGGPRLAASGLALQLVHELTAAAALPAAALQHLASGGRGPLS